MPSTPWPETRFPRAYDGSGLVVDHPAVGPHLANERRAFLVGRVDLVVLQGLTRFELGVEGDVARLVAVPEVESDLDVPNPWNDVLERLEPRLQGPTFCSRVLLRADSLSR